MATDPLRGGCNDDVGTVFDRSSQVPSGTERVVDDERDSCIMGNVSKRREIRDVESRISNGFEIEGLCPIVDSRGELLWIVT